MNKNTEWTIRGRLALALASGSLLLAATDLSGQAPAPATPAPAAEEGESEMETLTITGSRLTGAAAEGMLSVSTYNMDTLTTEGYSDIGDLVRKRLPQFGGGVGTYNDSHGNGGSGIATVSLRSLPGSRTLFLVNGRRTSADIHLIPTTAIARMEVLNDGASAVYGSEAIAGVVNVILKKDFSGLEIGGRFADTTDKHIRERRVNFIAGGSFKNISATLAAEYSKAGYLLSPDREVSIPSGDAVSGTSNPGLFQPRALTGEVPTGSVLIPLRWRINPAVTDGLTPGVSIPAAFNPNAHLIMASTTTTPQRNAARDAEEARLNGLMGANSPVVYGPNYIYFEGVNAGFPYGYYTMLSRPHERAKYMFNLDADINENLTLFFDGMIGTNISQNFLAPSPLGGTIVPSTNYWFSRVFPTAAQTGRNYTFGYRPTELGPRVTENEFTSTRAVLGLRGKVGDSWTWEAAIMDDNWKWYQIQKGGVLASVYTAALAGTTEGTAFNPFGFSGLFATSSPVNTDAMIQSFSGSADAMYKYRVRSFDATVSGEIFDLPAGRVGVAAGLEIRREKQDDMPSSALVNMEVFPFNAAPPFFGDREIRSGYVEASVPVIESLSFTLAGRVEDYNDVGSTGIKPRVAFRWEPISKELTIRGSWAQGFVAPGLLALKEGDRGQSYEELLNPITGTRTQPEDGVFYVGNPNLKPAESDSYLIGVVYSPKQVKGLTVGINYYRIEETMIPFESTQYIVEQWAGAGGVSNANNPFGPNAQPSAQNPTGAQVVTLASGEFDVIRNIGTINSGDRQTDGIDLFAMYEMASRIGTWNFEASASKVMSFDNEDFPGAGAIDYLDQYWGSGSVFGNYGFPKWKGSSSVTWKNEDLSAALVYNYVSGYSEVENDYNRISSYQTFDVRFGWKSLPFVGADLLVGVNNVTDKQPPFLATSFENGHDRAITDVRGRIFFVELNVKF